MNGTQTANCVVQVHHRRDTTTTEITWSHDKVSADGEVIINKKQQVSTALTRRVVCL